MNELTVAALAYLKDHWGTGMARTTEASSILEINPNTWRTRLHRKQAMVFHDDRGIPTFSGFQLVHNLLQDRLLRYGITLGSDEKPKNQLPYFYTEWAYENILSDPHYIDAIIRFRKEGDGGLQHMVFEDGEVEKGTGDAALIIPLGTMVARLALKLYMRSADPDVFNRLIRGQAD